MNEIEHKMAEQKTEKMLEDWYDNDFLELPDENFKKAPPISVAEYKARTCEVLPQGIFDGHDIHGIAGKGNSYNGNLSNQVSSEQFIDDSSQEYELYDKTLTTTFDDGKAGASLHFSNGKNSVTDQQLVTNKVSEKQKKKKKKFKQLDLHTPPQNSKWNQPWTPDFANKFKNNDEFPPL